MNKPFHKTGIPSSIWALGIVSLLMDTSSEIVHGLLPIFLVSELGARIALLGILEGLAEALPLIIKVFSGILSDWLKRRKPLVVLGYTMGALSKPLFAIAGSVPFVYAARLFDRMGKGIREAPRDALVADIVPAEFRGRAFGLRQSLDTVGAFLGPVLAIVLMNLTSSNYRLIFWIATIPGLLAVGTLLFFVHEKEEEKKETKQHFKLSDLKTFERHFWFVVGAGAVFQLARFSEAFLILRSKEFGLTPTLAPLVLIVMNIVYSLSAYPVGHFSDRIKREWFLMAGALVLVGADLCLATGKGLGLGVIGLVLWGLHLGLTQGIFAALVADSCPSDKRGTAYGLFNLFSALALVIANTLAGVLWDSIGAAATFGVGAGLSFLSLLAVILARDIWNGSKGYSRSN